ncbi:hypothetical protein AAG570_001171 [Ranatra chinensis]|uniref:Uncharacterized protein n=1 Tax=Ranatra chinensis TaxID=642074 RepID=A0ABD0YB36_9HEMI
MYMGRSLYEPLCYQFKEDCSDSSLETESYLKTTDKVISALAARISMDSGGESDGEGRGGRDSSTSESSTGVNKSSVANSTPVPATRYNRAFSLRRGRLDEPSGAKKLLPPQPTSQQQQQPQRPKPTVPPPVPQQQSISRTDTGRFSMRSKQPLQSSQLSLSNNGLTVAQKKKSSGGRSNSTLSSKEVEFQNWKRRKNYDPMKAAAEGKRKEAAKKTPIPPNHAMTQSTTNATTTPKSPVNSVLRSASFHGTRQLAGVGGGPSSSEEDEEITLSAEDEDWPIPQAPKLVLFAFDLQTSLENTPRGSRVSLYSNNSNSSPRTRHKLEGVDNLVVSAIYGMSNKLKGTASSLLKKLRYLYDEDSDKCKQLGIEIDSLEVADPSGGGGGSPHKSPSKELASTLRNLKRLDSSLKGEHICTSSHLGH